MSAGGPGEGKNSGGSRGGKGANPPNLNDYVNTPRYDLATIVQLVGVRPMILWGWEQQLGIPAPTRINDEIGAVRRYSERDLIASIWLRDQILNGISPVEAAARLRAAQHPATNRDDWEEATEEDSLLRGRVNTGPLSDSTFMPPRVAKPTRPLSDIEPLPADLGASFADSPPQRSAPHIGALDSTYGAGAGTSQVWVSPLSGPLTQRIVSGPLGTPITSTPLGGTMTSMPPNTIGGAFGSSPAHPGAGGYNSTTDAANRVRIGGGVASTSVRGRDLRALLPQLIRAFINLDSQAANYIIAEAMASRTIETVGINLLQPALNRISDLSARHDIAAPEDHFAMNYVRGLLFAHFRETPENAAGPLVIVTCGPRELDDIPALMLAVYWRRIGLRVIYLGQDMDSDSLVELARLRRPALMYLSASTAQRIRALVRTGRRLAQLDKPRPNFAFGGPIFARNPELQRKVSDVGVYLGDDAATMTWHVTKLLGVSHR